MSENIRYIVFKLGIGDSGEYLRSELGIFRNLEDAKKCIYEYLDESYRENGSRIQYSHTDFEVWESTKKELSLTKNTRIDYEVKIGK